ncbi:bifunctional [glutamate--ammonia ligase]-adenylyl-L-tyrosine phosphorylase/[glutamate--ammonia-ligase] adenylyltransferase [Limnohabitans sp. B9-3]|uniref:bifunctional [glutamate--ammonia ligase]-adenylyl-L-tyrosine phosphorylase/[glutamate--ammonia-ligase] adenylyltransferase n=1 Tax=Limnohabitans sp. B9-3 TaxID=1100707 RepID=UPI001E49527F|nr:bifunctional [glutamate--ammonia ligase]-adenylyl-L-tyrosine phosphorylase/[glutamate--ammonia-ligase] adenylyltransferase [Limnohabitans sp. B9-3]
MTGIIPPSTGDFSAHSRLVQRLRRRYGDALLALPAGEPVRATMQACFDTLRQQHSSNDALRMLRQCVMERLVVLDTTQQAPLGVVTRAMTELAEFSLDVACVQAQQQLDSLHGAPLAPSGARAVLWVVGMGKLGARELNVSSDIDLIYVYDEDGDTAGKPDGRGRISNHDYFAKAVKLIYSQIGDTTEHGFVFRMDLALRPNGNSGPSVVSRQALEDYFLVQGREWERFAWLKSRVVAPFSEPLNALRNAAELRDTVLPFVFRRYLDYSVFAALRNLHQQIRHHTLSQSAGRPERANDVKLGRGGIREIEFTVQLLQVVRGGHYPELRTRPTLDALQRLGDAKLMPASTADALAKAYVFLRQVEHRIQYLDDQQTHQLPTAEADLLWIAQTMGCTDVPAFLAQLGGHRELVAYEFDHLLGQGEDANASTGAAGANASHPAVVNESMRLTTLLPELNARLALRVTDWAEQPRIRTLRDEVMQRLLKLLQRTNAWVEEGRVSEEAAVRWCDWMEPLLRRESYLALLVERPRVHEQLLRLLGLARWPAKYLLQHPGVIDELASPALLRERFDAAVFEKELEQRRQALQSTNQADEETLLNLLRRAHHAEVFRTLARDVEQRISVEQVADDLSALADSLLKITSRWVWQNIKQRHREEPQFAILAYGKLGGKELGYGSDLDIVFVVEDTHPQAGEIYATFVRKLINWLSVKTSEGDLYEIDTALRPNGNSGLLVSTFEAYANYQEQRGNNTAWTWEHQAMTRARFCIGMPDLKARFDTVRANVINAPRDPAALRAEIVGMRDKLRAARPVKEGFFDVKHSAGGMVDVEFAVQFLVLAFAKQHPALLDNVGNIALLQHAEMAGLLPLGVGVAAGSAYRELRRVQHRARLDELPTQVPLAELAQERAAILALWQAVFA